MTLAIAAFAFRVAPATGTGVLRTGQRWVQWMACGLNGTVPLIATIGAIVVTIALFGTIQAQIIAEELIPAAIFGSLASCGYEVKASAKWRLACDIYIYKYIYFDVDEYVDIDNNGDCFNRV